MTIITIFSDDGKEPFAAMIAADRTGAAQRVKEIAQEAERCDFIPAGSGRDVDYLCRAHERQLQEIGELPRER